jgi:Skp family chaperone for outer membrane proteins
VGLLTAVSAAQTPGAQVPAAPAAPATQSVPPQAIPAKIALIAFEQAVFATNEGQKIVEDVKTKFAPQKTEIDGLSGEVDALKKQLQGASATLSDADRAAKLKAIDAKEKQLNRKAEEAQTAYNADLQEAYAKVAQKVSTTLKNYVAQNGYTLLLDVSNQQSAVMWALPNTDVTEAVVTAYNASSGIAAPAPAAPSATRPTGSGTAPKPAAPKPAAPRPAAPK